MNIIGYFFLPSSSWGVTDLGNSPLTQSRPPEREGDPSKGGHVYPKHNSSSEKM